MSGLPPGLPSNLGEIEAPYLIGVMVSCALFGITCAQTAYYYRTYPGDHLYRKLLVAGLFLLETVHLGLVGEAGHFLYVVTKLPENVMGVFFVRSTFAVSFALTILITSLVQAFYAWRVWSVSRSNKVPGGIAVGVILFSSFAQFGLGITADAFLYIRPQLTEIHSSDIQGLYSAQLAIAMFCDIVITLSLVFFLNQSRSGFRSTENIIDRLIIHSVNIGLVTSAISIVTFITFHALSTTTHFTAFTEIISKIYVNSLLVTLNSRKGIRTVYDSRITAKSYPMSRTALSQTRAMQSNGPIESHMHFAPTDKPGRR